MRNNVNRSKAIVVAFITLALVLFSVLLIPGIKVTGSEMPGSEIRVMDTSPITVEGAPEYVPGELIVKFKKGVRSNEKASVLWSNGLSIIRESPYLGFKNVQIPKGMSVPEMAKRLENNPLVEYACPNHIARIATEPNDPLYPFQWHMDNSAPGGVNAESAWDIETGDPGVVVAIVDTGVAYEDYGGFLQAPDLAQTSFVPGYDFVNSDSHPNDDQGHGTHVAGTVAQSTNNSLGVAGVAFNCSIMPVKVLDSTGWGQYSWIADGICYAADNGADIINLSLGGMTGDPVLENACQYAYEGGVTLVCCSHNDSGPIRYPAAYDDYCVAVGATRYDGTFTDYSNYGPQQDLVAPGGDVDVDQDGNGSPDGVLQQTFAGDPTSFSYYYFEGTSMAAPHVSGVAALIISQTGNSNPDFIRNQLESTARDCGPPGWDQEYGNGLIDAAAALGAPVPRITSVTPGSGHTGTEVTLEGTSFGATRGASSVNFNLTPATNYISWSDTEIRVSVPVGATTGPLSVTKDVGTSNWVNFDTSVQMISISPDSGPELAQVTIDGTNFGETRGSSYVDFNGTAATNYISWSDTEIEVEVPVGATTGPVTVNTGWGNSNEETFTLIPGCPWILSVSPTSGGTGTPVTVEGFNFGSTQGSSYLRFKYVHANIISWSDTQIECTVPAGTTSGDITVTTGNGTSNGVPFTVTILPFIDWITPGSGSPGQNVTFYGSNFGDSQGSSYVSFNGTQATEYVNWYDGSLVCKVPAGATSGEVTVTTADGTSNGVGFIVTGGLPPPSINSISPTSGEVGSSVTIIGSNFGSSRDSSFVKFGATQCLGLDYVSWNDTQIIVKVPSVASGTVQLKVTTGGGTSNGKSFTVIKLEPDPEPDPEPEPKGSPIWYLAEGSTAWGYDCHITIENPNDTAVSASITYMTDRGAEPGGDIDLAPKSQATVNPASILGECDFSTKVECKEGKSIAVDRTMSWPVEGVGAGAKGDGHCSIGVTAPDTTWYLPEGSSAWGFECWLLIQNPNGAEATAQVTYMIEGEGPETFEKKIPANSRKTYNMANDIGNKDASIKVAVDIPVIPERAMYRYSRHEGHDSIGTTSPVIDYYLAEGTTAWGFTTYVLIQNPQDTQTSVDVTYMTDSGPVPHPLNPITMDPNSRFTIRVNDYLPGSDFSTQVTGSQPIIAERAMYWGEGTAQGEACHDSIGMDSSHSVFYLPDGQTSSGYETWTLVQNPNDGEVEVRITYLTEDGTDNVTFTETIGANQRDTYSMVDKGITGRAAVMVECLTEGEKIMVERAMYWNSRGAGTDTIGGYSD